MQCLVVAAVCACATGCRHKPNAAVAPPVPPQVTVALVPAPEPANTPQVQTVPVVETPVPKNPVQPKPKKRKKKVETAPPPPPVQVASAAPVPDASVIGALTAGGDAAPAAKQSAADEISGVEKRLAGLSAQTQKDQEAGLAKVKAFLRQAHEALKTGDADGAETLATKAKVLLDDLLK